MKPAVSTAVRPGGREWTALPTRVARAIGHAVERRPIPSLLPWRPSGEVPQAEPAEFLVQWFQQGPDGLRALKPIRVPDEQAARTGVESMPPPVPRAVAFRIERPDRPSERTTIVATRDRAVPSA